MARLSTGRSRFAPEPRRGWHFPVVTGAWLGLLVLGVAVLTQHGSEQLQQVLLWLGVWVAARRVIKHWRQPRRSATRCAGTISQCQILFRSCGIW